MLIYPRYRNLGESAISEGPREVGDPAKPDLSMISTIAQDEKVGEWDNTLVSHSVFNVFGECMYIFRTDRSVAGDDLLRIYIVLLPLKDST